ncbi:MAG: KH domain-containing protein [Candidatus Pacearchaeota archaeon]
MRKLFFSGKELYRILKLKNKIKKLESRLKVEININEKGTIIIFNKKKDSFAEYVASKVLEAIALGFDLNTAMQLCNTDFTLAKINAKDLVRSSRVNLAVGRVIGKKGRTKELIGELSGCKLVVSNRTISIIGRTDNVETARQAIISLIKGSKQSNIYNYLEKNKRRLKILEEEKIEELIEK